MTIRPPRHQTTLLAALAPACLTLALLCPAARAAAPTSPLVSQQAVYDLGWWNLRAGKRSLLPGA